VDGEVDLRSHLQILTTARVAVSVPATRVMLPAATASELSGVVREALANVDKHAGEQAKAWILLEDLGTAVVLSVRDDGPGIPAGRLPAAEGEGRMGVAKSIKGRVSELGGSAELITSAGQGTEWELRVPRVLPGRGGSGREAKA
jgi:signal transduction histidine kinase